MTHTLRVRARRAALPVMLAVMAMALAGCGAPYSTADVNETFSALPGVEGAEITSPWRAPNADLYGGRVDVSPTISVDEYTAAMTLALDHYKLEWAVGVLGDHSPSFAVFLDRDSNPDDLPAAATWVKAAVELNGVTEAKASLVDDDDSESTALLEVNLAHDIFASELVPLTVLTDLDRLTSSLPHAGLQVTGQNINVNVAPYTPVALDALNELTAISRITAVDATYVDGKGGMLVTVAVEAHVAAAQALADHNRSQWGAVTVMGPYDDFNISPGNPTNPSTVATAKKTQALPGDFAVNVGGSTVHVRDVTLKEIATIDAYLEYDSDYHSTAVDWHLKSAGTLTRLYKPAGHPLVMDPLVKAARLDGVEVVHTTVPRYQHTTTSADSPAVRVEITAERSDPAALMQKLRAAGFGELRNMEAQFTVRDPQVRFVDMAEGTLDEHGDLVDLVGDGRGDMQGLVAAWNDPG